MMVTIFAILVILLGLICWLGQTLVVIAPSIAETLGVGEPEAEIDRSMYLFERYAQGVPDILLTWTLPASALMLLLDLAYWPLLALLGAGVYLYFPAVFILTRIVLRREGLKVGRPRAVFTAFGLGALWILAAIGMAALAVIELDVLV